MKLMDNPHIKPETKAAYEKVMADARQYAEDVKNLRLKTQKEHKMMDHNERAYQRIKSQARWGIGFIICYIVFWFTVVIGIIATAIHFIAKLW